jgi:hypothetical protein
VYYVRCNTRSSGASAKGTPAQALDYITDAHDAERDPSYANEEIRYIARLEPGWKAELEGGRLPLVGLGALKDVTDQAVLAHDYEDACQPYHDRRGKTGYLSYTFTLPKELSLVAEGHREQAKQAMYAAMQTALDSTFPGKEYKAVTTIHVRNKAGEIHHHAHVLIGKFARDRKSGKTYSLNSKSGGNTGKLRLRTLKQAWKDSLDAEIKIRLGITITQAVPHSSPALTLPDGTYVPPLNRESRRLLDKHLCFRLSTTTPSGAVKTSTFRWTHFDRTIFELASGKRGRGWDPDDFRRLFPKLAPRLKSYQARIETLKRIGYLTPDGHVTHAFTLHYRTHQGDHPELQALRSDLAKVALKKKPPPRGPASSPPTAPPGSTGARASVTAPRTSTQTLSAPPSDSPTAPDHPRLDGTTLSSISTGSTVETQKPTTAIASDPSAIAPYPTEPPAQDGPILGQQEEGPESPAAPRYAEPTVAPADPVDDKDDYPEPLHPTATTEPPDDDLPPPEPEEPTPEGENVDLWLALHRHQQLLSRLERLGVAPDEFKKICEASAKQRPSAELLQRLRSQANEQTGHLPSPAALPQTKGVIRAYCALRRAEVVSFFTITKGLLTLRPGEHRAVADKIRTRAKIDFFYAKERRLAVVARRFRPLFWLGRIVLPREVHRLELALQRCGQLATRQHTDRLYRDQLRHAYRNSRDRLLAQLRDQARAAALSHNPKLQATEAALAAQLRDSAASLKNPKDGISLAQLRRGLSVLETARPAMYRDLAQWRGREQELIDAILLATKTSSDLSPEHRNALMAGRIGYLLDREAAASSTPLPPVPERLQKWRSEITRTNVRLAAAGVPSPFTVARLDVTDPRLVQAALDRFRQAGLLEDGPVWALKARAAYPVAQDVKTLMEPQPVTQKDRDR